MFIEYDGLVIRGVNQNDNELINNWWNDSEIIENISFSKEINIPKSKNNRTNFQENDESYILLMLEVDGEAIGQMNFKNLGNDTAELGIIICIQEMQGMGYGTNFLKLIIAELFYTRHFQKILLDTSSKNLRAQHVYEKMGFRKIKNKRTSMFNQKQESLSMIDYELVEEEFVI